VKNLYIIMNPLVYVSTIVAGLAIGISSIGPFKLVKILQGQAREGDHKTIGTKRENMRYYIA